MSRIFAITVASETVRLDAQGKAEVSFTVSNVSGNRVRGHAKIAALSGANEAWFSIEEKSERYFAPNETHQFTVKIALPGGGAAGDYAFRLNVYSEDNPDDDYTEGPVVKFTVAGSIIGKQVVVARRLQWGRIILSGVLSAIVSLAIILIGAIMIGNKPTKVSPSGNPAGDLVGGIVATLLRMLLWFLLYFPLASLLSALFTMLLVQYRRMIHTALSLAASAPIAIVLLWLVSLLTK